MVKILKEDFTIPISVPNGLLRDQQACQINALKTIFYNIKKTEIGIENLKDTFDHDEKRGSSHARYNFQRFNNHLLMQKIPYRTHLGFFDNITNIFPLLSQKIPIAIYFGIEVLKLVQEKVPLKYNFSVGEGIYYDENKHMLILIGTKEGGEKLLFLDPVHQLPFLEEGKIVKESQIMEFKWKEAFQHYKHYNTYINVIFDQYRAKKFDEESKKKQRRLI